MVDYELITRAFIDKSMDYSGDSRDDEIRLRAIRVTASYMCRLFEAKYKDFDSDKFLRDCGVIL